MTSENTNTIGDPVLAIQDIPDSGPSLIECPICNRLESYSHKHFQLYDLDKSHICFFCKKARPIKQWKCSCKVFWHTCAAHSRVQCLKRNKHVESITATGKPTSNTSKPGPRNKNRKRSLSATASYQEILEDDIKRSAKRKADEALSDMDLGPCQSKPPSVLHLGPILKKRFYGY